MLWWAGLLFFQQGALDLPNVRENPHTSAADVAFGQKLYGGRCAGCHGPAGDGGKGANLAAPVLQRAQDDLALYRVIRYGLPDTEMPSHNLTEKEVWQISAYVRSLGRIDTKSVSGNASRGAALVKGKGGCLQCHLINGDGGHMGPSLSDIGRRRSPAYLQTKLIDPAKELSPNFSLVQFSSRTGEKVSGVWMNEDTWSVQVRDMSNKLHSVWKADLTELKIDRRTPMPSYRERFSKQEMDDVVAYLMGLRGEL
jgi:cytochrome c oxidase cbb3-type subunit 3